MRQLSLLDHRGRARHAAQESFARTAKDNIESDHRGNLDELALRASKLRVESWG